MTSEITDFILILYALKLSLRNLNHFLIDLTGGECYYKKSFAQPNFSQFLCFINPHTHSFLNLKNASQLKAEQNTVAGVENFYNNRKDKCILLKSPT